MAKDSKRLVYNVVFGIEPANVLEAVRELASANVLEAVHGLESIL